MNTSSIGKAWKITIENPVLWIFGILAGCASQTSSSSQGSSAIGNLQDLVSTMAPLPQTTPSTAAEEQITGQMTAFLEKLQSLTNVPDWFPAAFIIFGLLISILFLFLAAIGRGGLIHGTIVADGNPEAELKLGQLWDEGAAQLWNLVLFSLLVGIIIFIATLAIFVVILLITAVTFGIGALCLIPLSLVLIPVGLLISAGIELGCVAIVVEKCGPMQAVSRAWGLVKDNKGPIILYSLVIWLITFVISLILVIPVVLITPGYIQSLLLTGALSLSQINFLYIAVPIFLLVSLMVSGLTNTFNVSAWTLYFQKLSHPEEPPVLPIYPSQVHQRR